MLNKTLHEIEYEAWSERASYYDEIFAHIPTQAIDYILDSLGDLRGKRHIDVACGTGHLVGAASERGAISEGTDFAESMVEVASANYPKNQFYVADALDLPYEDNTFDVVTCSFGLLHLEYPQKAVNEAFRVLKAGGRFAFTLWYGNDENNIHKLLKPILSEYKPSVSLPESWTQLRYADTEICADMTNKAGFNAANFEDLPIIWEISDVSVLRRFVQKLSVRTNLIIESQPEVIKKKIYAALLSHAESRKVDGIFTMNWSALLTCAQKPK